MKQQQMMNFLARAMQNPAFLQQLVHQKEKRKELEEALSKKRRRPIDQGQKGHFPVNESSSYASGSGVETMGHVKVEPLEFRDSSYLYNNQHTGVSELEALALEMQGYGRVETEQGKDEPRGLEHFDGDDQELDEEFWEELLSERVKALSDHEGGRKDHEDVNVLADRLGYLGSSPKLKVLLNVTRFTNHPTNCKSRQPNYGRFWASFAPFWANGEFKRQII